MSCCDNLQSDTESKTDNKGLVCEASEGSKDFSRTVRVWYLRLCRSETLDLLVQLLLVSWAEESAAISEKNIIAVNSSGTSDINLDIVQEKEPQTMCYTYHIGQKACPGSLLACWCCQRVLSTLGALFSDQVCLSYTNKQLRFYGCRFPALYKRHTMTAEVLWLPQSFCPSSVVFLEPCMWEVDWRGINWGSAPHDLHFDQLRLFVMVSVCYPKKLLWWGVRATFM